MSLNKQIYITGPSGQLGMCLRQELSLLNIETIILSRKPLDLYSNEKHVAYKLGDEIQISKNSNHIYFFHFAYEPYDRNESVKNINYIGLRKIIKNLNTIKKKSFIYISTVNCNDKSTIYNRQKNLAETLLSKEQKLILRPSLIYSRSNGLNKIFYRIRKFIPFPIPIPTNKNNISPIIVEDFVKLLIKLAIMQNTNGIFLVKGKKDINFMEFLKDFHGIKSFYVSIKFWVQLIKFLRIFNNPKLFYLSERINGLINLPDINKLPETTDILNI